jgi:3-deoxy-D-manno-octulosonate 8-phosphate phosphatase KdsC-like HAD superfamily phosphatase
MCRRKNIPFYWAPNENEKYDELVKILRRYSCTPDQTIYIASKVSDRKCVQLIPKSMCPDDAGLFLKEMCFAPFVNAGGRGILVELLDLLKISSLEVEIVE